MPFANDQELGRPVQIKDEGIPLVNNVGSIDFTGAGVTGSAIGANVTENIPGGGAGAFVLKTGDTMTGTLNINPSSDVSALTLQEFSASPTSNIMQVKNSAGVVKWIFNKTILNTIAAVGVTLNFDTANGLSTTTSRTGLSVTMLPGFTGGVGGFTGALGFDNQIAGADNTVTADATTGFGYRIGGNRGITGFARGTTSVGFNSGVMIGAGNAIKNFGAWVTATTNKTGGVLNVGAFADGWSSSVGAIFVGGYFTCRNQAGLPTFESCAVCADNDNTTAPVALFRDNGVTCMSIADGGLVTITQATLGNEIQRLTTTTTNSLPRESVYQNKVLTTDATITTLATIAIPVITSVLIEARVVARRTGGTAGTAEDTAAYIIAAAYKNVAGVATEVGETAIFTAENQAGWDCTVVPSAGNALIRVTGALNNNISWVVTYRLYNLST